MRADFGGFGDFEPNGEINIRGWHLPTTVPMGDEAMSPGYQESITLEG